MPAAIDLASDLYDRFVLLRLVVLGAMHEHAESARLLPLLLVAITDAGGLAAELLTTLGDPDPEARLRLVRS